MKLENNQLVFETIPCWSCDGKGSRKYGILCRNYGRKMHGKKCPFCGSKSKDNHQLIGEEERECGHCKGAKMMIETEYNDLPKEIFDSFPIEIQIGGGYKSSLESITGAGLVGGARDYGGTYALKDEPDKIKEKIREEYDGRQAIGFLKDGKLCDSLLVVVRQNDYSVYPVWK